MNNNAGILLLILLLVGLMLFVGPCDGPGPEPIDPASGPRVILCLRELGRGTIDEIDAAWQIREATDASTDPDTPPFLWLPSNARDERAQIHGGVAAYASLGKPLPYVWDIVSPAGRQPVVIHEGPLDAATVLGWVGLTPRELPAQQAAEIDPQWVDVDFSLVVPPGKALGWLPTPKALMALEKATIRNVREMPGFQPIPRSEWPTWEARFPIERAADQIIHVLDQDGYGSCVGNAGANGMEGPEQLMFGAKWFRPLSAMSLYKRIGRSPSSGAYTGDAADELSTRGILPGFGTGYPHEFSVNDDWSKPLPSGWEATGCWWLAGEVYYVDDQEAAFAVTMRDGGRIQIGRKGHSISVFGCWAGRWYYENSWGQWGSHGKGVGADSFFTPGYYYVPCVRPEIPVPTKA